MSEEKFEILNFTPFSATDPIYAAFQNAAESSGISLNTLLKVFNEIHAEYNLELKNHLESRFVRNTTLQNIFKQNKQNPDDLLDFLIKTNIVPILDEADLVPSPKLKLIDSRLPGPAPQLPVPSYNARYLSNAMNSFISEIGDVVEGVPGKFKSILNADENNYVADEKSAQDFKKGFLLDSLGLPKDEFSQKDLKFFLADAYNHKKLRVYADNQFKQINFYGYSKEQSSTIIYIQHKDYPHRYTVLEIDDSGNLHKFKISNAWTIMPDLEDGNPIGSIDKKGSSYKNILNLCTGKLSASFQNENGVENTRHVPAFTKKIIRPDGSEIEIHQVPLLMPRVTGIHRTIQNTQGNEVNESIMDLFFIGLAIKAAQNQNIRLSESGKIPLFIPKLQSIGELESIVKLLAVIEKRLSLPETTFQIALMDEEFPMTLSLLPAMTYLSKQDRLVGTNTGFLDWMSSFMGFFMFAGPFKPISALQTSKNKTTYEVHSSGIGLYYDLLANGQQGKGMETEYQNGPKAFTTTVNRYTDEIANTTWFATAWSALATALGLHRLDKEQLSASRQANELMNPKELLEWRNAKIKELVDVQHSLLPKTSRKDATLIESELRANMYKLAASVYNVEVELKGASSVTWNTIPEMSDFAVIRLLTTHTLNWLQHGVIDLNLVEKYLGMAYTSLTQEGIVIPEAVKESCSILTQYEKGMENLLKNSGYVETKLNAAIQHLTLKQRPIGQRVKAQVFSSNTSISFTKKADPNPSNKVGSSTATKEAILSTSPK